MKLSLIPAVIGCALAPVIAQDGQMVIRSKPAAESTQKEETVKIQTRQSKANIEFENFFANLSKSNNIVRVFDLTEPVDVKKSKERVFPRIRTERIDQRAVGIKLLSIRF